MKPRINDGDLVTIVPCNLASIDEDEVVLVRLNGNWLLHLVKAIERDRVQIGNNHGKVNGWAGHGSVLGRVTQMSRV